MLGGHPCRAEDLETSIVRRCDEAQAASVDDQQMESILFACHYRLDLSSEREKR